jgi:hypothetical protein
MEKNDDEYWATIKALGNARGALNALREHFDLMSKPYIEYIEKLEKELEGKGRYGIKKEIERD